MCWTQRADTLDAVPLHAAAATLRAAVLASNDSEACINNGGATLTSSAGDLID